MNLIRFLVLCLLLVGCESQQPIPSESSSIPDSQNEVLDIRPLSKPVLVIPSEPSEMERLIADILFEGLQALEDDRLLTPLEDNAHSRFQRVLAMDPENEIANDGLERILMRYVDLSQEASRRGLFEDAEELLGRAEFINEDHPSINLAWSLLESEKESGDLIFSLDTAEFLSRSEIARSRLNNIAQQARELDAFFLITAPNDDLARWMYLQMRNAVDGYRLRGNIELANQTSIRLRLSRE
ncbi:MAG: hypothetical protein P8N40_08710 [Gammaproteobacteria bacterium]|nr:hypothetical protein [Gammaproteobacteria bacterium]